MMPVEQKEIELYVTREGKVPYEEWFEFLKDVQAQSIILKRLARVRMGNLGEWRSLGEGVGELKIDFGPGYRIYFGQESQKLVILLCGGDKGTQTKDINNAFKFWKDYQQRRKVEN